MTVELAYDHNCPNIAEARENLLRALALAHLPPTWTEWDLSIPDAPAHVRGFGSPAVLVNAHEVTGLESSDALSCCRLYRGSDHRYRGAPQTDLILSALKRESGDRGRSASQTGMPRVLACLCRPTLVAGSRLSTVEHISGPADAGFSGGCSGRTRFPSPKTPRLRPFPSRVDRFCGCCSWKV